jgi:hypothetical protein
MSDTPRPTTRLTLVVTWHTLLGGRDNPNCFSLAERAGDQCGVRVVNMKMGPFQRMVRDAVLRDDVEAEVLAPGIVVLTDPRIPPHELHNDRWCGVCCPFRLLPEAQQRARLRRESPIFRDGELAAWGSQMGVARDEDAVERDLAALRAVGAA